MECKSQTIYTHTYNTSSNQKMWACVQVTQTWPECVVLTSVGRFSLFWWKLSIAVLTAILKNH
jgi:hypothetical protein